MTSLGNQIQEARKKANMTQAQLADAMGVSREEIAAWEKDEQVPSKKLLQKMGDQFGTVFFDPGSVEAQRKSDEKLEKVKAAEFQGKTGGLFGGNAAEGSGGNSKMWLIPLALALVLALAVYLMLQPKIDELTNQVGVLKQSLSATSKDADEFRDQMKTDVGTMNGQIDALQQAAEASGNSLGDLEKIVSGTIDYSEKNLMDGAEWTEGYYIRISDGGEAVNDTWSVAGYQEVMPNKTYTIKMKGRVLGCIYSDTNSSSFTTTLKPASSLRTYTFTTGPQDKYIRLSCPTGEISGLGLYANPEIKGNVSIPSLQSMKNIMVEGKHTVVLENNYASVLPDLDKVSVNSIFILNFSADQEKPKNLPDPTIAYNMATLMTFGRGNGQPYRVQYLFDRFHIWARVYGNSWDKWYEIVNNTGLVYADNFETALPDLDLAPLGSHYVLKFDAADQKPLNMPDETAKYDSAILITVGDQYKAQLMIDGQFIYKREFADSWSEWKKLDSFGGSQTVHATPENLIGILREYENTGATVVLASGTYDVYEMYKAYFGSDCWDNYAAFARKEEKMSKGLWVSDLRLVGSGNTVFTFTGNLKGKAKEQFSLFLPAGNGATLESLAIDCGDGAVRCAVWDEYADADAHVTLDRLTVSGTPSGEALIGGKLGQGCVYTIENCVFTGNGGAYDIVYRAGASGGNPSRVWITNCFGEKAVGFFGSGAGTEAHKCIVNNSSFPQITAEGGSAQNAEATDIALIKYLCSETPAAEETPEITEPSEEPVAQKTMVQRDRGTGHNGTEAQ